MFTGIIQNLAQVKNRFKHGKQIHFDFQFKRKEKRSLSLGESIAVEGVCLTVVKIHSNGFGADAVRETLEATTLGSFQKGDWVNTERALRYGDSLGGHFVSGHVDGHGKILKIEKSGKNRLYYFSFPEALRPFIAPKGSIVIDGISLTIQKVQDSLFTVTIVPHTWKETSFRFKISGNPVNLEVDLIARYLHQINTWSRKPSKGSKKKSMIKTLKRMGF